MIAWTPPAYLKPLFLGCDPPRAPAHLPIERDRRALEPGAAVFADDLAAAAEVEPGRAVDRVEQLDELRRRGLAVGEAEQVALRGRVQAAQEGQDLLADQAALRAGVRAVAPEVEPLGEAVRLGVLTPAAEERADDAVRAAPVDLPGRSARDDAIEDGLDLVRRRVARRAQPVGRERVADLAPLVLGASSAAVDDLGAEDVAAERGVLVRLAPAQAVVHVQRRDLVAELAQRVPEAGGVRSARDEARDRAAGRDQLLLADVGLDRFSEDLGVHSDSVAQKRTLR